jgi:arylsulfatase A-like enzyme
MLVDIMSDNGYRHEVATEQPSHMTKCWAWQGGLRVPMIARDPGIPADSLATANVVNDDLLPTFLE